MAMHSILMLNQSKQISQNYQLVSDKSNLVNANGKNSKPSLANSNLYNTKRSVTKDE